MSEMMTIANNSSVDMRTLTREKAIESNDSFTFFELLINSIVSRKNMTLKPDEKVPNFNLKLIYKLKLYFNYILDYFYFKSKIWTNFYP